MEKGDVAEENTSIEEVVFQSVFTSTISYGDGIQTGETWMEPVNWVKCECLRKIKFRDSGKVVRLKSGTKMVRWEQGGDGVTHRAPRL